MYAKRKQSAVLPDKKTLWDTQVLLRVESWRHFLHAPVTILVISGFEDARKG